MARVFVVGAGYVGSVAAGLLAGAGHEVHLGRRSPGAEANAHRLDVLRPETYPPVLAASDCVVYAVAADGFTPQAYRDAYVEGLARVIEAVSAGATRRLVFLSSTGVYGQGGGGVVDEDSATEPAGFSGRALLEGEALLAKAPFEATALRLSGIYGPGRDRVLRDVVEAKPLSAAARAAITNRIHRDDCARAIVHLAGLERLAPRYVGSDEEPTPLGEIADWIAERLGLPPRPPGEDAGPPPQRGGPKRCSSGRLRASGFRFAYPTFREGFGALIEARRAGDPPKP